MTAMQHRYKHVKTVLNYVMIAMSSDNINFSSLLLSSFGTTNAYVD